MLSGAAELRRELQYVSNYSSFLMIGRVGERRSISVKPALRNAEEIPVHANVGGMSLSDLGSTGYISNR